MRTIAVARHILSDLVYDGQPQKADFLSIIKKVNPKFINTYGTIKIQAFHTPISKVGIADMIIFLSCMWNV